MIVSYTFMISCDSVKPRLDSSLVEFSTSVNMMVTVPSVCPIARLPMIVSTVRGAEALTAMPRPSATALSRSCEALKPASPCG